MVSCIMNVSVYSMSNIVHQTVYYRIQVLQEHRFQVEEFDQALQKFFKWGESFLSSLHSFSHVDITDLQPFTNDIKVRSIMRASIR